MKKPTEIKRQIRRMKELQLELQDKRYKEGSFIETLRDKIEILEWVLE